MIAGKRLLYKLVIIIEKMRLLRFSRVVRTKDKHAGVGERERERCRFPGCNLSGAEIR